MQDKTAADVMFEQKELRMLNYQFFLHVYVNVTKKDTDNQYRSMCSNERVTVRTTSKKEE